MLSSRSKALWIAFPIVVTAVSIFGVTKLRQNSAPAVPPESQYPEAPAPPAATERVLRPPVPASITIPAHTRLVVRLDQSISSNRFAPGDRFFATVSEPVVVDSRTVISRGAPVKGRVVADRQAGRLKGVAEVSLALESVEVDGKAYPLHTSTYARAGHNHNKRNVEFIGGGGGAGALLGALVGHGKGALIGAPIGAGAGVAGAAFTGKKDIVIPAETPMTFQILEPVELQSRS